MEGIRGRPGFVSCALLAQGLATNPGHGLCSAPLAQAMPGAHPHLLAPLASAPARFLRWQSGCPFNHFRSAFFCFTSGLRLALLSGLHLAGQRLHAPSLVDSLRRASLAFAMLGQARLGLHLRKKKPRSNPAPQPRPAVLRLACARLGHCRAGTPHLETSAKWRKLAGGTKYISCIGLLPHCPHSLRSLRAERPQRPIQWL